MRLKVKGDTLEIIKTDLSKKYLKSGRRIAGKVEENRIKLYTEDDFGKRSVFLTREFRGEVSDGILKGEFKISLFVIILLIVLLAVCVESVIVAFIINHLESIVFPIIVIACVAAYFLSIKHISKENDTLIIRYLEELESEDSNTL